MKTKRMSIISPAGGGRGGGAAVMMMEHNGERLTLAGDIALPLRCGSYCCYSATVDGVHRYVLMGTNRANEQGSHNQR